MKKLKLNIIQSLIKNSSVLEKSLLHSWQLSFFLFIDISINQIKKDVTKLILFCKLIYF